MFKTVILVAAISLGFSGAVFADGYKLDAKGKCHDASGKFAKQELCSQHSYKLDAKGKCHDESGKFTKTELCHA